MDVTQFVNSVLSNADYYVLLLFRVSGVVFSSPLFGRVGVPQMVKMSLALSLSLLFFNTVPPAVPIVYSSLIGYLLIIAGEVMLGIALAYVTSLFFAITFVGGQMIDMQIGFGIVNVYDPQNNTQIPMIGNMLNSLLLIVFFGVNGHHRLFLLMKTTLERIPVGSALINPAIGLTVVEIFAKSFLLGVMVALPVVASGLVLEIAIGVLVRTVPQMNVFVVGLPIKILVGFFILLTSLPMFVSFSETVFGEMFSGVEAMFATFAIRLA